MSIHPNLLRNLFRSAVCVSASIFPTIGVYAEDMSGVCLNMKTLTSQAGSNFMDSSTDPSTRLALKPFNGVDNCRVSMSLSGGNVYHCAWKFPYRDAAAHSTFQDINQTMRDCFVGGIETIEDEGVNHPDSYEQHKFLVNEIAVSVSIKDKSALQETYVFVGIEGIVAD